MPILIRHDNYGQMGQTAMNVGREQLRQVLVREAERRAALRLQEQQTANQFALGQQGLDLDRQKLDVQEEQGQMQFAAEMDRNRIIAAGNANNNRIRELMEEGRNARNFEDNDVDLQKAQMAKETATAKLEAYVKTANDKIAAGTATAEMQANARYATAELMARAKAEMQKNALGAKEEEAGKDRQLKENVAREGAAFRAWDANERRQLEAIKANASQAAAAGTAQQKQQISKTLFDYEDAMRQKDAFIQELKAKGEYGDELTPTNHQYLSAIQADIERKRDAHMQMLKQAPAVAPRIEYQGRPYTPSAPAQPNQPPASISAPQPVGQMNATASPVAAANLQAVRALLAQGVDALNPAGFQYGGHAYRHVGNGMFQQIA